MQAITSRLVRNTDTNWSYLPSCPSIDEIQLEVPSSLNGDQRFGLICSIAKLFNKMKEKLDFNTLQHPIDLNIDKHGLFVPGQWKIIADRSDTSITQKIKQFFPFTHMLQQQKLVRMKVIKIQDSCLTRWWHKNICKNDVLRSKNSKLNCRLSIPFLLNPLVIDFIKKPSFSDPFTELAARSAQTTELHFVMEAKSQSSFRYVLKANTLNLEEMPTNFVAPPLDHKPPARMNLHKSESSSLSLEERGGTPDTVSFQLVGVEEAQNEENKTVVGLFITHLQHEYGFWLIDFLKASYDIDLAKMHELGLPLTPDHVLKANVGANNIEMGHIFALLSNLKKLTSRLALEEDLTVPFTNFLRLHKCGVKNYLSLRELRNLISSAKTPSQSIWNVTCQDILKYISNTFHIGPSHPKVELNPTSLRRDAFNELVGLIAPKDDELDRIFTGRKIRHTAICGYNTMGNKSIPNKCRDLFELLHIFPQLKTSNWSAYYELLSHVVAKKTLYRPNLDDDGYHVGILIPGPNTPDNKQTWYYNDTFIDDSNGNFSYTLKPACEAYRMFDDQGHPLSKPLPYIKLYRSTASDDSNPNSADSVAADFNFHGPGSLKPELSYQYEKDTFEKRTIPMWMGYVLLGQLYKDNPTSSYKAWIHSAVDLFSKYRVFNKLEAKITKSEVTALYKLLAQNKYSDVLSVLIEQAHDLHELPDEKIGQDIAFVGHSLGGALAQAGVFEFCTQTKRIPLPGYSIICATSHTPATENKKNAKFITTGDNNEEMLLLNNIHFFVTHQLEKGDVVPQSGESHLGSTVMNTADRKHSWLTFSSYVFAPLPTAQSKEIVTAPTHGRRTGHSVLGRDYSMTPLSQQETHDFDHAWFLCCGKIARVFGYRIIACPKVTELLRRDAGVVKLCCHRLHDKLVTGPGEGDRDKNEVLYMRFSSNRALQQLTTGGLKHRRI